MKSFHAIAAAALLTLSSAHAADKLDCKSANLNDIEMDTCAGRDFNIADTRLNALYKTLMSKYDMPNQAKLKIAERAWLAYRDSECDYEANGSAGGTMNPMVHTICLTSKTKARIKELDAQLHCPQAEITCNAPG